MGSRSSDLYDAIFEVDATHEFDLFEDSDDDVPALRSLASRESLQQGGSTPQLGQRPSSLPRSPRREPSSPVLSPRRRVLSHLSTVVQPTGSAEISSQGPQSPLTKLFGPRLQLEHHTVAHVEASVKRMEGLLEDIRELPVRRLKDEMKELQVGPCWNLSLDSSESR